MSKKTKLVNKVKRLLKRVGLPRWLHHYGPKKYEFLDHALAYIIKQECKLGYRRVTRILRGLGRKCPCASALCTSFHKVSLSLWKMLLKATIGNKLNVVAIDGTGISSPLPSPYYYKRIDKPYPVEIPLKLSIAVDTKTKKILSLRLRSKKSHDIKDARYLIKNLPSMPKCIVADKGYDAEWLHQYCEGMSIKACIPCRDFGKSVHKAWSLRKQAKYYNKKRYGRREIVEAIFGAIKRKFGASVSSIIFSAKRAEMYCRAIAHNILVYLLGLFERSRI